MSDITNATIKVTYPKNYGYIRTSLPKKLFTSLRKECSVAEEKSTSFITELTTTYPNTSNHYELKKKNKNSLSEFVENFIGVYEKEFDYIRSIKILGRSLPFIFDQTWINIQKNNQYIPLHTHDGVYSYTCWIDLPPNSLFEFLYPSTVGTPIRDEISLTPEDEGDLIFFPAGLQHTVHPFEGDNKRISISGNILLGVDGAN